jgi:ubiquinone/menaquinone biosynthesis C-methylase UbiE
MSVDRDVTAFDERATRYDRGWLGRLHHDIAKRSVEVALSSQPHPRRILDVGCGTGYLLRLLATRCPGAVELAGVDPAASMIDVARESVSDRRIEFAVGFAEHLPYPDHWFDLVVSTTSFDHWADQRAGVAECARVLAADGALIVADMFSRWLTPTLVRSRKGKARTTARVDRLLAGAGLRVVAWHDVSPPVVKAVVAAYHRSGDRRAGQCAPLAGSSVTGLLSDGAGREEM